MFYHVHCLLCYPTWNVDLEISIIIFFKCRNFKNIRIKIFKKIAKENETSFGNFQTILFFEIKSSTLIIMLIQGLVEFAFTIGYMQLFILCPRYK